MNQYGAMARKHWQRYRPAQLAAISDQPTFFEQLGEQISEQIAELAAEMEGTPPAGESFLERIGRLNMARTSAQEQILREMLPPAQTDEPQEPPTQ